MNLRFASQLRDQLEAIWQLDEQLPKKLGGHSNRKCGKLRSEPSSPFLHQDAHQQVQTGRHSQDDCLSHDTKRQTPLPKYLLFGDGLDATVIHEILEDYEDFIQICQPSGDQPHTEWPMFSKPLGYQQLVNNPHPTPTRHYNDKCAMVPDYLRGRPSIP